MKLDGKNMKGFWSTDSNKGIDFFIINDALFENLCILGEEVEPCFEGADITAPKLSSDFSLDGNFAVTLYSMMNELKQVLTTFNEGGSLSMDENKTPVMAEDPGTTEEFQAGSTLATEDASQAEAPVVDEPAVETTSEVEDTEFKKKEDDEENTKENEDKKTDNGEKSEDAGSEEKKPEDDEEDEDKKKKKFELLESEFAALKEKYDALEAQYNNLVEFKNQIDNEKKDELINRFYMLSDEDKADVIANKEKYSLDDIEAKLSVICVRKKVNFDLDTNDKNDNTLEGMTTFNVNSLGIDNATAPEWVEAMRAVKKKEQWS
jgi:autonomous glycyl radical cofactor GrcA